MNKMRGLIGEWEDKATVKRTVRDVQVQLTSRDVAGVQALCELYPGISEEQILTDIIACALDEIEEALPYVKGSRVISEDEFGDPIYEDVGKSAKFKQLVEEKTESLEDETKNVC